MENLQEQTTYELVNLLKELTGRLEDLKELDYDEKLAYTPREGMKKLGVGQNTMYCDLLLREDFPSYRIGDKWFISKKGLEEWVNNQHK